MNASRAVAIEDRLHPTTRYETQRSGREDASACGDFSKNSTGRGVGVTRRGLRLMVSIPGCFLWLYGNGFPRYRCLDGCGCLLPDCFLRPAAAAGVRILLFLHCIPLSPVLPEADVPNVAHQAAFCLPKRAGQITEENVGCRTKRLPRQAGI